MGHEAASDRVVPDTATRRRLLLIWQDAESRQLVKVGQLDELVDGHYLFAYLPGARHPNFTPLVQFPDLDGWYESPTLPAFFVNRVMSRSRPSYSDYRHWIGLDEEDSDTPFEVLIRTGGSRATDTSYRRRFDGRRQRSRRQSISRLGYPASRRGDREIASDVRRTEIVFTGRSRQSGQSPSDSY